MSALLSSWTASNEVPSGDQLHDLQKSEQGKRLDAFWSSGRLDHSARQRRLTDPSIVHIEMAELVSPTTYVGATGAETNHTSNAYHNDT